MKKTFNRREFLGLSLGLALAGCGKYEGLEERVKNTAKKEIIETYRFNIGAIECIIVNDRYDNLSLFCGAPKERLEQVLREYNIGPNLEAAITSMVINTNGHQVLLETASGSGKLLQNLQNEGIEPEDIDTVILTHGHWDHIGWNTDEKASWFFPTPDTLCGKMNGISGHQKPI